ncbi:hypothetical protein [Halobacillus sp. Marseille-Q1614]|uniref:hypothetical protein n=1 Tax=Halobacillus sp. Marseille-Q1614 TaxID=2709134 RepID=UPI00156F6892|nr:hypothetical protein [Halobacillus sp. Marseille-Q1614]
MNELMDHRLKKMNHQVKYEKVPMGEHEVHKMIHQVKNQPATPRTSWAKTALPFPAMAILAVIAFQFYNQPSDTETFDVTLNSQRSADMEMKDLQTQNIESAEKIELVSGNTKDTSTIVRQTYIIHNDEFYVQTGRQVQPDELDKPVGTATPKPSESQKFIPFTQHETIYAVKGEDEQHIVAIKSWQSTGIGSGNISQQGYFVFEKEEALPIAQ